MKLLRLLMALQVALCCAISSADARMSFDSYGSGKLRLRDLNRQAVGPAATPPGALITLNGADLTAARARLAATKAGTADTVVAHVGDSIKHGYQNNGANGTRTGTAANAPPAQLAALSQASLGVPGRATSLIGASDESITYLPTYDPRYANGGTPLSLVTTGNAANALGGRPFTTSTAGRFFRFTPADAVDTIDAYWLTDTGASDWDLTFAGTAVGTILGNQAQAARKQTFTFTRGTGAIQATKGAATGSAFISGIDAYDSTIKSVRHLNLGWGGAKAADLASTAFGYSYLNGFKTIGAHVTFIMVGTNDWTAGTTTASFKASVQALIDAARLTGLPVLETQFPSDLSVASQAAQDAIVNATRELGVSNGIPVIEHNARFGSYTQAAANGYTADFVKLHPNTAGYALMADGMNEFMKLLAQP
ncbi:SGNH/GDSL hydrolase family protein [Methylobacterium iners]|uniref:SGNH hydrolase-type esterase domain-containing protein n=1 Tax=Methylobacterium iners TaxID=418707 RepID=A0ABQ4S5V0_9HYPH|nr:SGNH/GDSL hydrolase family protein [Methylobacterium iners]GJD97873.1 hypothetical protein OCOJLMKI_5112 [Methylobacterium iners]